MSRKTLGFKADESKHEKVEEYAEEAGYETKSEAANELVEIGLREAKHPAVYQWYQRGFDVIGLVLLIAVFATFAGLAGAWAWYDVARYVAISVVFALSMLAILIFVRIYYGQTELGEWLRGGE